MYVEWNGKIQIYSPQSGKIIEEWTRSEQINKKGIGKYIFGG